MGHRAGFVRRATAIRWAAIAVIVVALVIIRRALPLDAGINALRGWIENQGAMGYAVYGLIYAAATVLFVPGTILTLAAGAMFEFVPAFITISLGSTLGAALAFLVARYFARARIAEMARKSPRFDAIDKAIAEGGWKIVALLRLSPAVPFNAQNYFYGLTAIRFWPYVLTSWLAMMPGTFLYVYIGVVTGKAVGTAAGTQAIGAGQWALWIVGLLATIGVTVYITRLAQKKIREHTAIADTQSKPGSGGEATAENNVALDAVPRAKRFPWGTLAAVILAVLVAGAAVFSLVNPDGVKRLVAGLFGPPRVIMQETYAADTGEKIFDHSAFDALLKKYVDDAGFVDYAGLATDSAALDNYLAAIGTADFAALGRNEKLALLLNAYNAFTLRLILDYHPVASIRDIPAAKRWDDVRFAIAGTRYSLNQIEHEQIRRHFIEPRIHFALVCAAVGCPPLRREAYTGAALDAQLAAQTDIVHTHERWFRFEPAANTVHLTELYNWYGSDFAQVADDGDILNFAAHFAPALRAALAAGNRPRIEWIPYDWSLNTQTARSE